MMRRSLRLEPILQILPNFLPAFTETMTTAHRTGLA